MPRNEIVSHDNNFAPQIQEYIHANEALADPITRRDYFEHMDGNDFIDMTQEIASLVRTGNSGQHQHFDGEKVALMTHEVPDQRHKEQLLRETWDTAKSFLTDRDIPDKDALEYAALTVAGGILYVHPFIDGNGRTSRFMSYIMAKGGESEESLNGIAQSMSNEWRVAPSHDIAVWENRKYQSEQPEQIEWELQSFGEGEDALGGAIVNSLYRSSTIRKFIETVDDQTKQLVETCVTRNEDGSMASLNGDKFLEVLVNDPEKGMSNAQNLIDINRNYQVEYVRKYLAAMRDDAYGEMRVLKAIDINLPEEPSAETESQMPSARKYYEKRKAKHAIIAGVLGERAVNGLIRVRDEAVAQHRGYSEYHRRKAR